MKTALIVVAAALTAASASAKTYEIDPAHSSVSFRVRHLVTKVRGRFDKFSGSIEYDKGAPETWKAAVEIDPASINTNVSKRDAHLRSADFFDVEKCSTMSFKTTKIDEVKGDSAKLHGELTMHCVTKPVTLDVQIAGVEKDPEGRAHFGASATGKINRKDWDVSWNKILDSGGVILGEDVELELDVEALPR